jgi:putative cell wall-binding protein
VLLVPGTSLPPLVRAELDRLNPTRIVVVGGSAVVSEAVRSALVPLAGSGGVVRRYGADRYATALAISQDAFPSGASWVHVATGRDFPDALAGAAAAGRRGGPMLLVLPATLPAGVPAELRRLRAPRITVLGGAGAVSSGVEAQLGAPY